MNPRLRNLVGAIAACLVAFFLGWRVAEGAYGLPALVSVVIVTALAVRLSGLPLDAIVLGLLLIGYIDGNRGFAQLMPYPGIPLLPAEIGLAVAVGWRGLRCAFERRLPFHRDPLNWAVLAWLVVGTARVLFDVPRFGLMAIRDYAVVYYALFFFVAQDLGRDPRVRRYLHGCLILATLLLLPLFVLTQLFPEFFLLQLTFRGNPLIYYKGDLLTTLLGIGSLLLFLRTEPRYRLVTVALSGVCFLLVAAGDNRASLVAVGFAGLILLLARRWRYPAMLATVAAVSLLAAVMLAHVFGNAWAARKLEGVNDRLTSLVDFSGTGRYTSEQNFNKGENNRFRIVWWKTVISETWAANPLFGLGFGTDIARSFVGEYFPDGGEDFSARSPHSVFVTAFGRMGLAGLAVWLIFCGLLVRQTWRVARYTETRENWALWGSACVILVSASLGVVLESPMGAVLFWALIGLGNAAPALSAPGDSTVGGALRPDGPLSLPASRGLKPLPPSPPVNS